jgi:hypothetical protein
MRIVLFVQSLVSDWNHGNAHFLRGVAAELVERGHELEVRLVERDVGPRVVLGERLVLHRQCYRRACVSP